MSNVLNDLASFRKDFEKVRKDDREGLLKFVTDQAPIYDFSDIGQFNETLAYLNSMQHASEDMIKKEANSLIAEGFWVYLNSKGSRVFAYQGFAPNGTDISVVVLFKNITGHWVMPEQEEISSISSGVSKRFHETLAMFLGVIAHIRLLQVPVEYVEPTDRDTDFHHYNKTRKLYSRPALQRVRTISLSAVKRVLVRPDDYVPKQRKRGWKMRGHDRAGHYRKGTTWIAPLKVNGGAQTVFQVKI